MKITVPMASESAVKKTAITRASIAEWRKVVSEYGLKIKPAPMLDNAYHIEGVVLPHSGDRPRVVLLTVDDEGGTYLDTDAFTKKGAPIPFTSIEKEAKKLLAYHVKYAALLSSKSSATTPSKKMVSESAGKAAGGKTVAKKTPIPKRKTAESIQIAIDKLVDERKVIGAKITELREELRSMRHKR